MCDEAVDDSLAALKLILDWLVTSKMIKTLYIALGTDEDILYFNEDSGNAVFSCTEMGILNIDLNDINLDKNFNKDYPDSIILIRLLAGHIKLAKRKVLKKELNEELMSIAWHSKRWLNFCVSEDEKKK